MATRDQRQFAMNRRIKTLDAPAKGSGKRLMAETDAKHWNPAPGSADEINGDAGIFRRAGTGRDDDPLWRGIQNFDNCRGVIADDLDLGTKIGQKMPQIPCKTVVIIDQGKHVTSLKMGIG